MPKRPQPPREPNTPLADPVRERFAGQRALGFSQSASYRTARGGNPRLTNASIKANACRMDAEPDVRARVAEINADMLKSSDAYLSKSQLAEIIADGIREAHKDPITLSSASGLIDKYCKMFGFYAPDKTEVRIGCLDDAQRDAKIAKLLKVGRS